MSFSCPTCGGTEFYAHMITRLDIKVDGSNTFIDNVHPDDIAADIYDSETPYGPYVCVACGAEYNSLS